MSNLNFLKSVTDMISQSVENSKYRLCEVKNESLNLKIYNTILMMDKYHCYENYKYEHEFDPILNDEELFEKEIYDKGYLESGLDKESFEEYGLNLSHVELQDLAEKYDLKTYGTKADIIKRITDNVDLSEIHIGYWNASPKGRQFTDSHKYIRYYNEFFYDFNFTDFENYLKKHGSDLNNILDYLNEHEEMSVKHNDIIWRCKSLCTYSCICASEGIDAFEKSIEEFCLRPLVDVDKIPLGSLYDIFDYKNFENIKKFSQNHSIEELNMFFNKYYSNRCRISKEEMNDILHEILTYDEFIGTSYDLCKKYGQK